MSTGGNPSAYIPTHTSQSTTARINTRNLWTNLSSWMPERQSPTQTTQEDSRFPGRGRTLASNQSRSSPTINSDSDLETRLLDDHQTDQGNVLGRQIDGRQSAAVDRDVAADAAALRTGQQQNLAISSEETKRLVSMGYDKTQVEVALAAADGDINVAIEILLSQQG